MIKWVLILRIINFSSILHAFIFVESWLWLFLVKIVGVVISDNIISFSFRLVRIFIAVYHIWLCVQVRLLFVILLSQRFGGCANIIIFNIVLLAHYLV